MIVGQIHANDDEPVQHNYRKLKGHAKEVLFILLHSHVLVAKVYIALVGSKDSNASEPSDVVKLVKSWIIKSKWLMTQQLP